LQTFNKAAKNNIFGGLNEIYANLLFDSFSLTKNINIIIGELLTIVFKMIHKPINNLYLHILA